MAENRILFLDMDGVLCTARSHFALSSSIRMKDLDPIGVALIDRLCEVYNFQIVISSTWRKWNMADTPPELYLKQHGLKASFHKDIYTPQLPKEKRGEEIQAWLDKHPETTMWWIVDDEFGTFTREQKYRTLKCDSADGITNRAFCETLDKLKKETGQDYFDYIFGR